MKTKEEIIKESGTYEIPCGDFVVHAPICEVAMESYFIEKMKVLIPLIQENSCQDESGNEFIDLDEVFELIENLTK